MRKMNTGDVITFKRPDYRHHAIFITATSGAGKGVDKDSVIHWWKDFGMREPSVLITPFQKLSDNVTYETVNHDTSGIDYSHVVPRAMAFKERLDDLRKGGENFSGLFDNSHHFVYWCCNRLGLIDITEQEIKNVTDPWRFVHGSVTNTFPLPYTMKELRNVPAGDIIRFFHRDYEHWALCLGNKGGVQRGIHLWDRDSVDLRRIVIQELSTIPGYCQVEIDQYHVDANGERAATNAEKFSEIVAPFNKITNMFNSAREFAFWCLFGLGSRELNEIQNMNNEEEVTTFVNGLIDTITPDNIRRNHNKAIQEKLIPGRLLTFSQGSQKCFGLCIGKEDGVMWWMGNGCPSIMVDPFEKFAADSKADILYDPDLEDVIDKNEMVNRARALRKKVNQTADFFCGLFSNSEHFATWIFNNYGPRYTTKTMQSIQGEDVWEHIYNLKKTNKPQEDKFWIRERNKRVLDALKAGDLVMFHRTMIPDLCTYAHFAVYIDNRDESGALSVIHWWNSPDADFSLSKSKAFLRTDPFWTVAGYDVAENGNNMQLQNRHIYGHEVVKNAKEYKKRFDDKGETEKEKYNLLTNNCEHFANKCRYGKKISKQVERISDSVLTKIQNILQKSLQ